MRRRSPAGGSVVSVLLAVAPRLSSTSAPVQCTVSERMLVLSPMFLRITNFSCTWLHSKFSNVGSGKAVLAGEPHQLGQATPGTVDSALDGADGAAEHLGGFLIGQPV